MGATAYGRSPPNMWPSLNWFRADSAHQAQTIARHPHAATLASSNRHSLASCKLRAAARRQQVGRLLPLLPICSSSSCAPSTTPLLLRSSTPQRPPMPQRGTPKRPGPPRRAVMSAVGDAGPSPSLRQAPAPSDWIGSGIDAAAAAAVIAVAAAGRPARGARAMRPRDARRLVRCAASSRHLCRCMLDDPAFLRRRGEGFAPSLLLGFFHGPRGAGTRFVEAPAPAVIPREAIRSSVCENAALLSSFDEPVACRSGLVVLRRDRRPTHCAVELCVCDTMTGRSCFLPPPEVTAQSVAILTGEDAGSSSPLQLLAVDQVCVVRGGAWGPVRRAARPESSKGFRPQDTPVVINRVAHWLSIAPFMSYHHDILALDADKGHVELIKGPRELERLRIQSNAVLLGSTADRRLSLVVVEELVISMFILTQEESGSWERRVVVAREGILAPPRWMRLDWFGGNSGAVVICMPYARWLVLNLETKEVTHLPTKDGKELSRPCCLYEMDLPSLIAALLKSPSSS
ncbi:hypothetical protein ACP70R_019891 [Stipagrostis hirtigluma subsp. patula]